jgi:hypothetical protein
LGQIAERPIKIHSAPMAHKPPKVGYACKRPRAVVLSALHYMQAAASANTPFNTLAGVAQPGRNTRHTDQQRLFQRAVGLIVT